MRTKTKLVLAVANQGRAMESETIKNGARSKSLMSRENILGIICFALFVASVFSVNAQDIIALRNGDEIRAKVEEVGVAEIRYKQFDNIEGPTRIVPKRDVFTITYENGTREVITPLTANTTASASANTREKPTNILLQKGNFSAGGHLATIGDSNLPSIGVGAMFRYNATDPIRLEGAFTYFFPKKDEVRGYVGTVETSYSIWDFSMNAHYLFPVSDKVVLYPLLGFAVLGESISTTASAGGRSDTKSGSTTVLNYNFGGGMDIILNNGAILKLEPKFWLGGDDSSYFVLSAGIVFNF